MKHLALTAALTLAACAHARHKPDFVPMTPEDEALAIEAARRHPNAVPRERPAYPELRPSSLAPVYVASPATVRVYSTSSYHPGPTYSRPRWYGYGYRPWYAPSYGSGYWHRGPWRRGSWSTGHTHGQRVRPGRLTVRVR